MLCVEVEPAYYRLKRIAGKLLLGEFDRFPIDHLAAFAFEGSRFQGFKCLEFRRNFFIFPGVAYIGRTFAGPGINNPDTGRRVAIVIVMLLQGRYRHFV